MLTLPSSSESEATKAAGEDELTERGLGTRPVVKAEAAAEEEEEEEHAEVEEPTEFPEMLHMVPAMAVAPRVKVEAMEKALGLLAVAKVLQVDHDPFLGSVS